MIGQRLIGVDERLVADVVERNDLRDDDGDVVRRAARERALHVLGRGLIDRQRGDLFQLRLFDESVQSVAAEDEDVVLL